MQQKCPDCNSEEPGYHRDTCPLALGLRAVQQADAFWFRRYPWLAWRTRPITGPERREARWLGLPAREDSQVWVSRAGDRRLLTEEAAA